MAVPDYLNRAIATRVQSINRQLLLHHAPSSVNCKSTKEICSPSKLPLSHLNHLEGTYPSSSYDETCSSIETSVKYSDVHVKEIWHGGKWRAKRIDYPWFLKRFDLSNYRVSKPLRVIPLKRATTSNQDGWSRRRAAIRVIINKFVSRSNSSSTLTTFMSRTLVNHYLPAANTAPLFAFDSSLLRESGSRQRAAVLSAIGGRNKYLVGKNRWNKILWYADTSPAINI